LRINEGREKPIDRFAKAFMVLTNQMEVRDPTFYDELPGHPQQLLAGLNKAETEEARSKIEVQLSALPKGIPVPK
jgi:hypothetical protein